MKLTVYKDNQIIQSIDLEKEVGGSSRMSFLMGRSSQCHVVLDSPLVSRELAELSFVSSIWSVKKTSDLNQLIVNGASISEKILANGDMITCGPFVVSIELPNQVVNAISNSNAPTPSMDEGESATETLALNNEDATKALDMDEVDELGADLEDELSEDLGGELDGDLDDDLGGDLDGEIGADLGADNLGDEFGEEVDTNDATENAFDMPAEGEAEFAEAGEFEEAEFAEGDGALDVLDDDDYEDDDSTKVFTGFASYFLDLFGEYAPYDKYKIDKNEIKIGRDPSKADIVLPDPEVSSVHAIVRKVGSDLMIEDLQSGNGTLLNGERINKAELHNHDEFLIGSTTFTVAITSDLLKQEEGRLMPVELNQEIEVEEIVEIDPDSEEAEGLEGDAFGDSNVSSSGSLFSKDALKDPVKRKKLLYMVVGLLALWTLLDEEQPEAPKPKAAESVEATATPTAEELNKLKQASDAFSKLSPEEQKFVENNYILAKALFDQGKYNEALLELQKIFSLLPDYKNARQIEDLAKQGLAKLEELARKEQQEKERKERTEKVSALTIKAKEAVKEKNRLVAEALFGEILRLDPENYDVPQMRLELEAWQKEQDRIKLEKATAEAERKRMVDSLSPGKNAFLAEEWYRSIGELEKFLEIKNMDEDLVKDATDMLKTAKAEIDKQVNPLLGKAHMGLGVLRN